MSMVPVKKLTLVLPNNQGITHIANELKRITVLPGRLAVVEVKDINTETWTVAEFLFGPPYLCVEYVPFQEKAPEPEQPVAEFPAEVVTEELNGS